MNDARLNYAVAMTAASYGASTVNYAKLVEMKPVTDGPTPLVKCTIVDRKENKTFEVYTRSIVNAGGPFTGEVEKLVEKEARHVNMVPSLGTHIVIDRKYCPKTQEAMIVPSSDGRVVFAIPWQGGCLLGTTDHKCEVTELPQPSQSDVDFLVKNIEPFTGPVPSSAVLSAWSGIRPLAAPQNIKSGATENISREHLITIDEGTRVLNIVGGKWTTYRKMSEDAVDKLCGSLLADKKVKACVTPEVVLYGARRLESVPADPPRGSPVPKEVYDHWRSNYGDAVNGVMELALQKDGALLKKLSPNSPVVESEVVWVANNEHCDSVADFLTHRTRMAFVDVAAAEQSVDRVADLMGQTLNWGSGKIASEKTMPFVYYKPSEQVHSYLFIDVHR
ncbi:glycerol-3-phosphate dehydrogenase [Angomonas deanei]|nr:glycerol-3-phosphate dehydrogenase [Angomonas deanei]|eukprot:EPY32595.1 glycerol-3-phosphate dehydrogenase [Angomonas deanei]